MLLLPSFRLLHQYVNRHQKTPPNHSSYTQKAKVIAIITCIAK